MAMLGDGSPASDRDRLLDLLTDFGLKPETPYKTPFDAETRDTDVRLEAHRGGVDGYGMFFANFRFDDAGKFVSLGIWE